ncbi:MAG: hypothetical protein QW520_02645 [Methanomassiliicoccales archaeon]
MQGRRVRFRGVKATPKGLEKDLLERSRRLAEDPSLLIPKCEQGCRRCPFDKLLKKMEKVQRYKEDAEYLISLASHGDQLVRAYAATISLQASGKIPFLTVRKLPIGDVSYAVRGKVEAEKLIGVQHFDDPDLRLLAFWDIARQEDVHIYSETEGLRCSEAAKAPPSFVKETLESITYELDQQHSCGHRDAPLTLRVAWASAGITITICSDCAERVNLLQELTSRIAARDPTDDFSLEVRYSPLCVSHSVCPTRTPFSMSQALRERYRKGEIDDVSLMERYLAERESNLRKSSRELYILGSMCYGSDKEAFIAALKGSEGEIKAISGLVRAKPMVILSSSDQTSKVIADIWQEHKENLLSQVSVEEIWRPLLQQAPSMPPGQMVQEAYRLQRSRGIIDRLPQYTFRGPIGSMTDDLARAFKTEGRSGMVRAIDRYPAREHRAKAVVYGFLMAIGEADSRAWQFTAEEKDFGKYLAEFIRTLLESEGKAYDEALRNVLMACGASETLQKAER